MMMAANTKPLLWDVSLFGLIGCLAGLVCGYRLFRAIQRSGRLEDKD
jgi:ubiquinone biosynthesis protein